jgi:hypothetical protein
VPTATWVVPVASGSCDTVRAPDRMTDALSAGHHMRRVWWPYRSVRPAHVQARLVAGQVPVTHRRCGEHAATHQMGRTCAAYVPYQCDNVSGSFQRLNGDMMWHVYGVGVVHT